MAKPKGCTYPNCFECALSDCCYDGDYDAEKMAQSRTQWRINNPDKVRAIQHRYIHSDQGIATRKRYANSDKNKAYQKAYQSREDVKEKKRIYAREYYLRKKQENENRLERSS